MTITTSSAERGPPYRWMLKALSARKLRLNTSCLMSSEHDDALLSCLRSFLLQQRRSLVMVYLPPYSASVEIVKALGSVHTLREYGWFYIRQYSPPVESGMCFDWTPTAFPALSQINFVAPLDSATKIVAKSTRSLLQEPSTALNTQVQLTSFTKAIGTSFVQIQSIELCLFSGVREASLCIELDGIRPRLHCKSLTHLSLSHN